ncbi:MULTISPECIES: hypothetical protein [Acinetobacter]|jgi:hypothetical protein|uniref:Uncharacterized protein n=1 Tax=Acinetobacter entericus TaxID=2989714 RepID=A0ABT3NLQ9_9GAMM|nr:MULTISPECIES: hypothetical protein [Acinetobacter]MCW8039870.1 hypothetical protein [Acinetobacter entericus]TCB73123.1 hypothetical protein E0H91_13510 [Acinetobacter sp. ANC 4177]
MNIRFDMEGTAEPALVHLKGSPTAQDCFRQISTKLELTDYASTEKWPTARKTELTACTAIKN